MVVYPRGVRTTLTVAELLDYEEDDYDLASKTRFNDFEEAEKYMVKLANMHNLFYTKKQHLLDE